MELSLKFCPYCNNIDLEFIKIYTIKNADKRELLRCSVCRKTFAEIRMTPMFRIKEEISKVASCIKLRSEGLGQNATSRVLNIHKNTVRDWERKFGGLKDTLKLYAICHKFISLEFEGDEIYTKVGKNKGANDSEGWTVILL